MGKHKKVRELKHVEKKLLRNTKVPPPSPRRLRQVQPDSGSDNQANHNDQEPQEGRPLPNQANRAACRPPLLSRGSKPEELPRAMQQGLCECLLPKEAPCGPNCG